MTTQRLVTLVADRTELIVSATRIAAGMPCSICHPSDRYAAEVVSVSPAGQRMIVRMNKSNSPERPFTWRKGENGVGYFAQPGSDSPRLLLGVAQTYLADEPR